MNMNCLSIRAYWATAIASHVRIKAVQINQMLLLSTWMQLYKQAGATDLSSQCLYWPQGKVNVIYS